MTKNNYKETLLTIIQKYLPSCNEAQKSLEMINDRNQTSHIYREEIAEQITCKIPNYYNLMKKVIDSLKPPQ